MASIEGIVFKGIDVVPFASVRLLTTSGHVVSEQTASIDGEFRFLVPSGLWGVEAQADDQKIAVRDCLAVEGERLPVYVCLATGERFVRKGARSMPARRSERNAAADAVSPAEERPSSAGSH